MNEVISKLSEIEAAAEQIMNDTADKKKLLSEEIESKTAAFDKQAAEHTKDILLELQASMKEDMKEKTNKLQQKRADAFRKLEADYDQKHSFYAHELFNDLLKRQS